MAGKKPEFELPNTFEAAFEEFKQITERMLDSEGFLVDDVVHLGELGVAMSKMRRDANHDEVLRECLFIVREFVELVKEGHKRGNLHAVN